MNSDECHCVCHTNLNTRHIVACCNTCPTCGKNIIFACWKEHQASHAAPIEPDFENLPQEAANEKYLVWYNNQFHTFDSQLKVEAFLWGMQTGQCRLFRITELQIRNPLDEVFKNAP